MQGIYTLVIKVNDIIRVTIRKKNFILDKGIYFYNGSALGKTMNIENRINWHLRKSKKIHWHIDKVTTTSQSEIIQIVYSDNPKNMRGECIISQEMAKSQKFTVPIAGFGASDCKNKCPAHFFRFNATEGAINAVLEIYHKLKLSPRLMFSF